MGSYIMATSAGAGQVSFTRWTSPHRLTKRITIHAGQVAVTSGTQMKAGRCERIDRPASLNLVAEVLAALGLDQAVSWGVPIPVGDTFSVFTKKTHAERAAAGKPFGADTLARSRPFFRWALDRSGVLYLDIDAKAEGAATPEDIVALLTELVPELVGARWLFRPSSSSNIVDREGVEVRGLRGFHLYTLVFPARAIPVLVERLKSACIARGLAHTELSVDGKRLQRFPFDASVFQPERLDYAAMPIVLGGRAVNREPRFLGGDRDVTDLSAWPQQDGSSERRTSRHIKARPGAVARPALSTQAQGALVEFERERLRRVLSYISPNERDVWLRVGMALKQYGAELGDVAMFFDLWSLWSSQWEGDLQRPLADEWATFGTDVGEVVAW